VTHAHALFGVGCGWLRCPVAKECRSSMNVVFTIQTHSAGPGSERKMNEFLQKAFVAEAVKRGMVGVEGHRYVC
jgi:phosphoserine aminotransferase